MATLRHCREAVVAAIIYARQVDQDLFVVNVQNGIQFGIIDKPTHPHCKTCYRISKTGDVFPYADYPTADELFAEHPEQRP